MIFFFFKQKTAYEMRISDWSSDVCSSDLLRQSFEDAKASTGAEEIESAFDEARRDARSIGAEPDSGSRTVDAGTAPQLRDAPVAAPESYEEDRKSVVSGKGVSVRLDLGGRRLLQKKQKNNTKA